MDNPQFTFDRIMIVDDSEVDRFIAKITLKKHQFANEMVEFEIASKALEYLNVCMITPEKLPQLIFLDIRMPEMDGFEFLKEFVKLPACISEIVVVMLSSSLNPTDIKKAEEINAVKRFVNKPLNKVVIDELKIAVFPLITKNIVQ